jgi:glycosyltransferase involved in cell wall biosynthesis
VRVLQVNTEKTWRGGERQTLYTIESLIFQGVDCQLMVLKNSLMHQKAEVLGIHIIAVESMLDALKKLSNLKGDFDLIHAQTGKAHTQCVLTKIFHQTPVVYTRRVDFVPSGFSTRLKYKFTNKVVSISSAISSILNQSGMCSNSPVISSAVKSRNLNNERALKLKRSLGIQGSTKIIGLVSALESHKDPITALKTIHELQKSRQDFAVLHFGNGVLFNKVSDTIKELNLDRLYFQMGHHENVEDYFSMMDVFLMTSKEEGLGSSVLDAFNYEVSVVSTNAGGLNNLVKDRGFLCNIGDIQCLSRGLSLSLDSSKESDEYKINAKQYCDNEMGVNLMAGKYIDLYQGLING